MRKKNRTVLATDEVWNLIQAYAAARGRSASNFLISTALSEISRHAAKKAFRALVKELVSEAVKELFPSKGEAFEGSFGRIGEDYETPTRVR